MDNYVTVWETYKLPSKGLIYEEPIDPNITLRSMTTAEEMKRLSPSDTPYKVMCDIIEDCMKEKPKVHVCDMSIGDYQYLLHKLRTVSYGPKYKMNIICPKCGMQEEIEVNLDDLKINEWSDSLIKDSIITLPVTNHEIELKFETPHDLDLIAYRAKEMQKKMKNKSDYTLLYTLQVLVKKVDGQVYDDETLIDFLQKLPVRDANYILNKATKLTEKVGIEHTVNVKCTNPKCGYEFTIPFRITAEFFGPSNDE